MFQISLVPPANKNEGDDWAVLIFEFHQPSVLNKVYCITCCKNWPGAIPYNYTANQKDLF